jgi:membrane protease YdiL (CAAX protease family)
MGKRRIQIEKQIVPLLAFVFLLVSLVGAPSSPSDVVGWFYYGGAFAVPLIIIATATLEFWELFLGETHYPFEMAEAGKVGWFEIWLDNLKVGFSEEILFRTPVVLLAMAGVHPFIPAFISSLLFGLAHWDYGLAKVPATFTAGMLLSAEAVTYGLPASVITHAFLDTFYTLQSLYLK